MRHAYFISILLCSNVFSAFASVVTSRVVPSLVLGTNQTNLTVPPIPPGLGVQIRFSPDQHLNSLGIWLNAIKLMYELAQFEWDEPTAPGTEVALEAYDAKISVKGVHESEAPNPLHYSHAVSGLLDAMNTIALGSLYCGMVIAISLHGTEIGLISISEKQTDARSLLTVDKSSSVTTTTSNNLGFSDQIIDPELDHRMKITYRTDGLALSYKYVLLMVLDGLATAAQFDKDAYCRSFYALDAPTHARAVFHIASGYGRGPFSYAMLTRTLYLLFGDVMLDKKRFYEMDFQVYWDDRVVAQGTVTDFSMGRRDRAGGAAAA